MKHVLIVTDMTLTEDFSLRTANIIAGECDTIFGTTNDSELVFRMYANGDTIYAKSVEGIHFDAIVYVLEKDKAPKDYIMDRIFELDSEKVLCTGHWTMDNYDMKYIYSSLSHEWDNYVVTKRA